MDQRIVTWNPTEVGFDRVDEMTSDPVMTAFVLARVLMNGRAQIDP